jgi:hypothetical protein
MKYLLFSNLEHLFSQGQLAYQFQLVFNIPDSKCINSHTDLFEESIIEQLSFFLSSFLWQSYADLSSSSAVLVIRIVMMVNMQQIITCTC